MNEFVLRSPNDLCLDGISLKVAFAVVMRFAVEQVFENNCFILHCMNKCVDETFKLVQCFRFDKPEFQMVDILNF